MTMPSGLIARFPGQASGEASTAMGFFCSRSKSCVALPPFVKAIVFPSAEISAPGAPMAMNVELNSFFHVPVSQTATVKGEIITPTCPCTIMGLLSCPTLTSQRPSRLHASLVMASRYAGILCSFWPVVASQISTMPAGTPPGCASHLPSGLTAIACEEAQIVLGSPPEANCQDHTLPIFLGTDLASLKSNQYAGNPFSSVILPASFHVSVFQILSVLPGNLSLGFAASHLPSALKAA